MAEVDNHHNALACPYCNPDNLTLAAQPPSESARAIQEHQRLTSVYVLSEHGYEGDLYSIHRTLEGAKTEAERVARATNPTVSEFKWKKLTGPDVGDDDDWDLIGTIGSEYPLYGIRQVQVKT